MRVIDIANETELCINKYMSYGKNRRKKKTVGHYLKIYFISIFVSFTIFAVGSFFKPQFDCANSISCKSDLSIKVNNDAVAIFQGRKINPPRVDLAAVPSKSQVLGV